MSANSRKKHPQFEIVLHYPVDDTDCSGDYYAVDVVIEGHVARHYGSYYDDKGQTAAEAFLEGYFHAMNTPLPLITYTSKNDFED